MTHKRTHSGLLCLPRLSLRLMRCLPLFLTLAVLGPLTLGAAHGQATYVPSATDYGWQADASRYGAAPGAPVVTITGGGGHGATATGTTNSSGVLTSVQLGSGGSGYALAPIVIVSTVSSNNSPRINATVNSAGSVTGFTVVDGGSGLTPSSTTIPITIVPSPVTQALGIANTDGAGHVSSIDLVKPGGGMGEAPTVTLSGGSGRGATATAAVGLGAVTSVLINNQGSGYTSAPAIAFSGGGGTGAAATATVNGTGKVVSVVMTSFGSGYTSAPTITLSGGGTPARAATLTAVINGIEGFTVTNGGSGYSGSSPSATSAAINAALAANRHVRVTRPGVYTISSTLLIPDDTTLESSPGVIYRLAPGASTYLVTNKDTTGGGQNVRILGGMWDCDANNSNWDWNLGGVGAGWQGHIIWLSKVRNAFVDGVYCLRGLKFSILLSGCTDTTVQNVRLQTFSDGVHVQGPSSNLLIQNVTGTCGDNMIALGTGDYGRAETEWGNINVVTVRNVTGLSTYQPVRLWAVDGTSLTNITLDGIHGSCYGGDAIECEAEGSWNGTMDNITIQNVDIVPPLANNLITITPAQGRRFILRNIADLSGATALRTGHAIYVSGTTYSIIIDGLTTDMTSIGAVTSSVYADSTASVADIRLVNCQFRGDTNATESRAIQIDGDLHRMEISDCTGIDLDHFFLDTHTTANPVDCIAENVKLSLCTYGFDSTKSGATYSIDNLDWDTPKNSGFPLRFAAATGNTESIRVGNIEDHGSAPDWGRSSTGQLRVTGEQAHGDIALLTDVAGDMVYNTNATAGGSTIGTGLCLYDGTHWHNLATGASW